MLYSFYLKINVRNIFYKLLLGMKFKTGGLGLPRKH